MKTLIVEDDLTSRVMLKEFLRGHGAAHTATDGLEAVAAVEAALRAGDPYDLICLDIMMPEMDGQQALKEIRALEGKHKASPGAKVLMTTALNDRENVMAAFREQCDGYLVKPLDRGKFLECLRHLKVTGLPQDGEVKDAPAPGRR